MLSRAHAEGGTWRLPGQFDPFELVTIIVPPTNAVPPPLFTRRERAK
jgi:hypothetical protein